MLGFIKVTSYASSLSLTPVLNADTPSYFVRISYGLGTSHDISSGQTRPNHENSENLFAESYSGSKQVIRHAARLPIAAGRQRVDRVPLCREDLGGRIARLAVGV
jgi:hypothetical protein